MAVLSWTRVLIRKIPLIVFSSHISMHWRQRCGSEVLDGQEPTGGTNARQSTDQLCAEMDDLSVGSGCGTFLCEVAPILQPRFRGRGQPFDRLVDPDGDGRSTTGPVVGRGARLRVGVWQSDLA